MTAPGMERVDGVPIAHLREDIDAATAARTGDVLAGALDPDASALIVDLADVRYLDSAGIDMLLRLGQRLRQRRARLMLVVPESSQLLRVIEIVGLRDAIEVHPTLDVAMQATKSRARGGGPAPAPQPDGSAVS